MRIQLPSTAVSGEGGCGRVVSTVFLSVFLFMGLVFCVLIVAEAVRELETWRWRQTPCEILTSAIEETGDDEDPYRAAVAYRYTVADKEYRGTVISRGNDGGGYGAAQENAARYPLGGHTTCYVNPKNPAQAVLDRQLPWFLPFILIPLVFVAVGGGGIYLVWRPSPARPEVETPVSDRAKGHGKGTSVAIAMGVLFIFIGGVLFVFIGLLPGLRLWRTQAWQPTPCSIISSTVRSHSSDDGTTYKVDILYEYRFGSQTLRSDRYDFANWSSSGYRSKREIVDHYHKGSEAVCYVDPDAPAEAVLERGFRLTYLVGLFPLLFFVAGCAALHLGLKQRPKSRSSAEYEEPSGPITLEPTISPLVKLFAAMLFALFWNGIVSVFLYHLVDEWRHGSPDWFLAVFLVPFVLVGLASIAAIGYFFLALFNPRPVLEMQPSSPRLGESIHVQWRMRGNGGRINKLNIKLEGREEATYQRGTTTHTDKETFCRMRLKSTEFAVEIAQGSARTTIPEDTMHSFEGTNNKVVWAVSVKGDIPRWPDVNASFPIQVRPLRSSS